MKRSDRRILTTHTGSLPRSPEMQELLRLREGQDELDQAAFDASTHQAVAEVVQRQIDTGLDVINDGEQGRAQYATYVKDRLTGFEGERLVRGWTRLEDVDFPEFAANRTHSSSTSMPQPTCSGPITWKDLAAVERDLGNLQTAVGEPQTEEVFMTAASPGVIAYFIPNDYYPDEEAYLYALADVMKDEYKAIVDAGFLLQVDCPDLAMTRVSQFSDLTNEEFRKVVEMHVEVLNHALKGLPPDRMRMHLCWGNTEGPHNHDIPLGEIVDLVLKAPPMGPSFERANPRLDLFFRSLLPGGLPNRLP